MSPYSLAWEEQPGSICFRITLAQQCPGGATADPLGCCPLFESTLTKVGCFSVASLAALSALTLRLSAFPKLLFSEFANCPAELTITPHPQIALTTYAACNASIKGVTVNGVLKAGGVFFDPLGE